MALHIICCTAELRGDLMSHRHLLFSQMHPLEVLAFWQLCQYGKLLTLTF